MKANEIDQRDKIRVAVTRHLKEVVIWGEGVGEGFALGITKQREEVKVQKRDIQGNNMHRINLIIII